VVEIKFLVDTTRTCLCWLQLAPCTCGILTQQVFSAVAGELIRFDIGTDYYT